MYSILYSVTLQSSQIDSLCRYCIKHQAMYNKSMTKYKQYFQKMLEENKNIFQSFEEIHAQYHLEPEKWQEQFNLEGEKVVSIIREYENRLCSHSEGGKYGKYSARLAEKFQALIKNRYPKIDFIGVYISKSFTIKKITFS